MFSVYCEQHGSEVLLGEADVVRVLNTAGGTTLVWQCWCGQRGALAVGPVRHPELVSAGR